MARISAQNLTQLEAYFRDAHPELPPLDFKDLDKDGRMDLNTREVSELWSALLRPVALRHRESKSVELSAQDITDHFASLTQDEGYTVLPNGLALHVTYDPSATIVSTGLAVFAGNPEEPRDQVGLNHLLEHAVLIHEDPTSHRDFSQNMKYCGAVPWKASTWIWGTIYGFMSPLDQFEQCFPHLTGLAMPQTFDPQIVDNELHGTFYEEYLLSASPFVSRVQSYQQERSFPHHPLGQTVLGKWNVLQHFTVPQLEQHHRRLYVPNNILLRVSGNLKLSDVRRMLQATPLAQTPPAVVPRYARSLPQPTPKLDIHIRRGGENDFPLADAHVVSVMFPISLDQSDPREEARWLLFSQILNSRIRETTEELNASYDADTEIRFLGFHADALEQAGHIHLPFRVEADSVEGAARNIIALVLGEVERVSRRGVTAQELEASRLALERLRAEQEELPPANRSDPEFRVMRYASPETHANAVNKAQRTLTAKDIQSFVRVHFQRNTAKVLVVLGVQTDSTSSLHLEDDAKLRRAIEQRASVVYAPGKPPKLKLTNIRRH